VKNLLEVALAKEELAVEITAEGSSEDLAK
jgi:hypothetical protein